MKPTLRILVRRNLKMSTGKTAAQVAHAVVGLLRCSIGSMWQEYRRCVVLEASDAEFERAKTSTAYVVTDTGKTEVGPGTETALAYWDFDEETTQQV